MKMILLAGAAAVTLAACSTAPQPYYGSGSAPHDTYGSFYYGSTPPTCCSGYFPYAGAPLTPPNPNVR